jgi:hypothetical protein
MASSDGEKLKMQASKISADEFFTAFLDEWEILTSQEIITGATPWDSKSAWTEKMLGQGGFFNRIMTRLIRDNRYIEYRTEWYSVDALYVGGKSTYGNELAYPSEVHALIEHEFEEDLETEMWKLIHWRAPLKVIVGYDWADNEKTTKNRQNFAEHKIAKVRAMKSEVDAFLSESAETEYLFIIARRTQHDSDITWQRF